MSVLAGAGQRPDPSCPDGRRWSVVELLGRFGMAGSAAFRVASGCPEGSRGVEYVVDARPLSRHADFRRDLDSSRRQEPLRSSAPAPGPLRVRKRMSRQRGEADLRMDLDHHAVHGPDPGVSLSRQRIRLSTAKRQCPIPRHIECIRRHCRRRPTARPSHSQRASPCVRRSVAEAWSPGRRGACHVEHHSAAVPAGLDDARAGGGGLLSGPVLRTRAQLVRLPTPALVRVVRDQPPGPARRDPTGPRRAVHPPPRQLR
jgi:hypothetical protein